MGLLDLIIIVGFLLSTGGVLVARAARLLADFRAQRRVAELWARGAETFGPSRPDAQSR